VSGVRVALAANASSCSADEYGDPFTVMGIASTRGHSNFSRGNFGWLTTANTQDVTATGTYSLHPIEPSDSAGVQALRIRRDSSSYLLLEYRTPSGTSFDNFSTSDPAVLGVSIRIVPAYSSLIQSKLIDTTPSTGTFGDAPLAVGRTFTDPLTGVTIATSSVSTGGASVQVTFGGGGGGVTPDTTAPSVPAGLKATKTGNKNKPRINLTWSASTDNVGVTGYRVYRNGGLLATVTTTSYTDTAPPKGTDSYTVVAFDAAGNASAASAPAVVSV
jgi:hypothetical protein